MGERERGKVKCSVPIPFGKPEEEEKRKKGVLAGEQRKRERSRSRVEAFLFYNQKEEGGAEPPLSTWLRPHGAARASRRGPALRSAGLPAAGRRPEFLIFLKERGGSGRKPKKNRGKRKERGKKGGPQKLSKPTCAPACGRFSCTSSPCSSATCCSSVLTSSSGVARLACALIAPSITCDCTSRFSNCRSKASIVSAIFSMLFVANALSRDLTIPPIERATPCILACVSRRDTTASSRDARRR